MLACVKAPSRLEIAVIVSRNVVLCVVSPSESSAMQCARDGRFIDGSLNVREGTNFRTADHRQIVRIGGVEQSVKILEVRAQAGEMSEVAVPHHGFVTLVLQNDDKDMLEMLAGVTATVR